MCGRFVLADEDSLGEYWTINRNFCRGWFKPRFNVPPTSQVPILIRAADGARELRPARWGLIPRWWQKDTPPTMTFNARSEDAARKPTWRDSFRSQRCLLPARGWYEWNVAEKVPGKSGHAVKQPYFLFCTTDKIIAFAGLWSVWEQPGADPVISCGILTRAAAPGIAFLHPRMPVVLKPGNQDAWLDSATPAADLPGLLADSREDFAAYPVSTRVNNIRNDDLGLMEKSEPPRQGSLWGA